MKKYSENIDNRSLEDKLTSTPDCEEAKSQIKELLNPQKPYFTKYLPIEGEIKEGDYYVTAPDYQIVRKCEDRSWGTFEMCKKVKLFLCSRDIQVGDKVRMETGEELICYEKYGTLYTKGEYELEVFPDRDFKVIGEISPDALSYVKEGDEFEESEFRLFAKHRSFKDMDYWITDWEELSSLKEKYTVIVEIKGPCGHFH